MTCTSHAPEAANLVQLLDGRQVCSCSEEWRHECECRLVLESMNLRQRREYLEKLPKDRRERVEATLTVMWNRRMRRAA